METRRPATAAGEGLLEASLHVPLVYDEIDGDPRRLLFRGSRSPREAQRVCRRLAWARPLQGKESDECCCPSVEMSGVGTSPQEQEKADECCYPFSTFYWTLV